MLPVFPQNHIMQYVLEFDSYRIPLCVDSSTTINDLKGDIEAGNDETRY